MQTVLGNVMFHHLNVISITKQLKLRARSRLILVEVGQSKKNTWTWAWWETWTLCQTWGGVEGAVFKVFLALEGPTILACTVFCKRSSIARNFGLDWSALTRDTIGF